MVRCSGCKTPVSIQKIHDQGCYPCLKCHSIAFAESIFEELVGPEVLSALVDRDDDAVAALDPYACFLCAGPMHTLRFRDPGGPARTENLWLFGNWRSGSELHRQGRLALAQCRGCGAYRMNARTLCRIPFDWDQRESDFLDSRRADEQSRLKDGPSEPMHALLHDHFDVPFLENMPELPGRAGLWWKLLLVVALVSGQALHKPWVTALLGYDPARTGIGGFLNAITSSLVHPDWQSLFSNAVFFAIFAPVVERELGKRAFAALLAAAAIGGWLAQAQLGGMPAPGLHSVVAAVVVFFGARFPRAVVGVGTLVGCLVGSLVNVIGSVAGGLFGMLLGRELGNLRFPAPLGALVYLFFGVFQVTLDFFRSTNGFAGLGFLGGAMVGYGVHLVTLPGPVSSSFRAAATARLKRVRELRHWQRAA